MHEIMNRNKIMLRKKTKKRKPLSPWTFRADATTLAIWQQIESAHPTKNASRIINQAIHLHGADATRLFLLQEQAKINVSLAMLATRSAGQGDNAQPGLGDLKAALEMSQRPAEAAPANGELEAAMKAIEAP
jgi:hypothetical protein